MIPRTSPQIEYSMIIHGDGFHDYWLEKDVESVWPNHRSYIIKTLAGVGMSEWKVSFRRGTMLPLGKGGGCLIRWFKMIILCYHTDKDEMLTTFLHYRNPEVKEEEIEVRSVKWAEVLKRR